MELTFQTELGESYAVEIDENMELENVMALLELEVSSNPRSHPCVKIPWIAVVHVVILAICENTADLSHRSCILWWHRSQSGIPVAEQSISYEGRDLSNPKATMKESGVSDKAILVLRRKVNIAGM